MIGYGVVNPDGVGRAADHAAFAAELGADYVTVNYPPDRDDVIDELTDLAERYDIDVAVHNYSSVHHDNRSQVFSSIADVREVLDRTPHHRFGLCVDTGHFLVENESPTDVLSDLGDRVTAVHLKDVSDANPEDVPGAGQIDLSSLLDLFGTHVGDNVPLVIEYELLLDRRLDALDEARENVRIAASE